jgi:hypothetical protein
MALLGFGDLKDQTVHALWDLAELKRLELRDGTTFDQMLKEAQDVANAVSSEITRVPVYSSLFSVQDTPDLEYGSFTGGGIQEMTEYSVPDPYRGKTTGHMLPIQMYTRSLGWTFLALENRRRNQLEADLMVVVDDIRQHYQKKVLQQFFRMEARLVGATSGASVPLADGGVSDANWVPLRSPDGEEFLYTHDHYLRQATPVTQALLVAAIDHLREHGHLEPYELLASDADAATYTAFAGWRAPTWQGIVYMDTTSGDRANLMNIDSYNGYIETASGVIRVKFMQRIPTGYYGVFKDYGTGSQRSPLRMRIDPDKGFGWSMLPGKFVNDPLSLAVLRAEWDIGTGEDRTNGVLVYNFASGDYVTPVIT